MGFYGCGNMGEAVLHGVMAPKFGRPAKVVVVGRNMGRLGKLEKQYTISTSNTPSALQDCDVILLGFKPQNLSEIPEFKSRGKIIVSMLAGTPIKKIQKVFPGGRYVRTMPNLGQFVEAGMTGMYFGASKFSKDDKKAVQEIFSAGGEVLEVSNEDDLNPLGAISGSGPAYYFYFTEQLIKAAQALGFNEEDSELLARQTLLGAAKILDENPDDTAAEWREKVTSKKGVTEQAILSMEKDKLGAIIQRATKAAEKKSKELGKG